MRTLAMHETPRAVGVVVNDDIIRAMLSDGRAIEVPIVFSSRLMAATQEQRDKWELIGRGIGIHWPDIDEDLSIDSMLNGFEVTANA